MIARKSPSWGRAIMTTKLNYNVQLLVDGKPVKEYTKDNKTFVEAKSGTEYSVRIKNKTGKRAIAIVSIDGINTITGEIAKPDSTGYVVNAFSSIEIKGYRQNNEGGGRFKFTERTSGYSKEIDGNGINSGVIGVLFIAEKEPETVRVGKLVPEPFVEDYYPPHRPYRPYFPGKDWRDDWSDRIMCGDSSVGSGGAGTSCLRSAESKSVENERSLSLMSFCSEPSEVKSRSFTDVPSFDRATTWGSQFNESIEYVSFNRSNETETHNVYYASREALKSYGVINDSPPQVAFPQSFPGFAKPPTGWETKIS